MAASTNASSAVRALALELKNLQDDPLEGIQSRLVNEDNIFEWEVALFGPPDTLYQGGYFKVRTSMKLKTRSYIKTSSRSSSWFNISLYISTSLFQANMKFPADYPYSPPSVRFITKVWHPNVYEVRMVE